MQKHIKTYQIKSYECDQDFRLRVMSLFNFLQDMADMHAEEMGVGYDFCKQQGLGWVGANYHVRIHRWPVWKEKVTVSTWPSGATFVSGIRDFEMVDETGALILTASSQWVLVDIEKMRPVAVKKHLPTYEIIQERSLETNFPKLPNVTHVDCEKQVTVLHDHIDFNQHANNANYPVWAIDSLPEDFLKTHTLTELEVIFKKPALLGQDIQIQTQRNEKETIHTLKSKDGTIEFASLRMVWTSR